MLRTGYVTHAEYQKHIRGEWRTIHNLWPHIRNYVPGYGYSRADIDAMFAGTEGSIAFADAGGFIAEDNDNFFWDAANIRLGVGVGAPVCRTHIRIAECADYDNVLPDVALVLENDANVRLQLQVATASTAYIEFCSDENNPPGGRVAYDFNQVQLEFGVGGDEILRLKAGPTFDYDDTLTLDGIVTISGVLNLINEGLHIIDTNASHDLIIKAGSDLTADRILSFATGDAARAITLSGNPTLGDWFSQSVKQASSPSFAGLYLKNNGELRFYDNGNYVGFEAPALDADQIWVLPDEDGALGEHMVTDGAGNLSWTTGAGTGDVSAAAVIADHSIVRGDGGAKGVQGSGVLIDDADNVSGMVTLTLPNEGLHILDTNASHDLIIKAGSDLTADRILSLVTGDAARTFALSGDNKVATWEVTASINLRNNAELRFYDNGNYVGFEAPALEANQIWVLPIADGNENDVLITDGDGNLSWGVGGGGAAAFVDLADTPANYVGAANKIVKVNAAPDALEFGADIEELDDVDTITGQAGKYAKVKAADAGIEWAVGPGGVSGPVLIFDSGFDALALGNIDGKGVYDFWGAWVNGSGAGCTTEIVADPGGGRMLRLDDQHAVNLCHASLTMTPGLGAEVLVGVVEWKVKVNVLEAGSRGYFNIQDKDIGLTEQGGYFRGDSNDIWYRSSGGTTASLVNVVVDTWYTVRTFFDRLGNYTVWWVDGAFEQSRIIMDTGDKFDMLVLSTWLHSGCVYDIKYVKVWSLNRVEE